LTPMVYLPQDTPWATNSKGTKMTVKLTNDAVKEAKRILGENADALRVGISGGGCGGYSYQLLAVDFEDDYDSEKDSLLDFDGLKVIVDRKSALYLEGTVLDYITNDLMAGFHFENPNAVKSCGCGQSFST